MGRSAIRKVEVVVRIRPAAARALCVKPESSRAKRTGLRWRSRLRYGGLQQHGHQILIRKSGKGAGPYRRLRIPRRTAPQRGGITRDD